MSLMPLRTAAACVRMGKVRFSYEGLADSTVLVVLAQLSLVCRDEVGLVGSTSVVGVVDARLGAIVEGEERAEL